MPATFHLLTRVRNGPLTHPLHPHLKIKFDPTEAEVEVVKGDRNGVMSVVAAVRSSPLLTAC